MRTLKFFTLYLLTVVVVDVIVESFDFTCSFSASKAKSINQLHHLADRLCHFEYPVMHRQALLELDEKQTKVREQLLQLFKKIA